MKSVLPSLDELAILIKFCVLWLVLFFVVWLPLDHRVPLRHPEAVAFRKETNTSFKSINSDKLRAYDEDKEGVLRFSLAISLFLSQSTIWLAAFNRRKARTSGSPDSKVKETSEK